MRGTESGSQSPIDLLKADLTEIGFIGLALSQTVSMVNFVLRLQAQQSASNVLQFDLRISTDSSPPVMGANVVGAPMGKPGAWFWLEPRNDGLGLGAIPAGATIDVTGHSLGGHLAGLATRLFPELVNDAVIFNAPSYDPATAGQVESASTGTVLGSILGLIGPAQQLTDEAMSMFGRYMTVGVEFRNVASFEAEDLAPGDDTDLISGILTGTPFGPEADIAVEMKSHSMGQIVDSLALQSQLSKLDPTLTLASFEGLLRATSNADPSAMELAIVALERLLVSPSAQANLPTSEAGTGIPPYVETGDFTARSAWYARWKAIQDAMGTSSLSGLFGQARIAPVHDAGLARTDVAAMIALTTGATFSLRLLDPSPTSPASLALYGVHRTTYERWLADRNQIAAGGDPLALNFTDAYLTDRATWANAVAAKNTRDEPYTVASFGDRLDAVSSYRDVTSGIVASSAALGTPGVAQIVFGSEGSDSGISGGAGGDRLYGGGGSDNLNGQGGNDWLEGNAGDDTLDGGEGNDALLGGGGSDTYNFSSEFGRDMVVDADGSGQIQWNGAALPQGLKVLDGLWQSTDRQVTYSLATDATAQLDTLVISFAGSSRRIVVRGWNADARNLGISFGGNFAIPLTTQNYIGDFVKKVIDVNGVQRYDMVGDNYVADGVQADAPDQITGLFGNEAFYGLGGNEAILGREGDDYIDGGDGLAWDRNANAVIGTRRELFGQDFFRRNGQAANSSANDSTFTMRRAS